MRNAALLITAITLLTTLAYGQAPASNVDFTLMTWPELKAAIRSGKTIALVFNGGTGQRGVPRDPNEKRAANGITGDARPSTPEIGKRMVDLKINYAVEQIQDLLKENTVATVPR